MPKPPDVAVTCMIHLAGTLRSMMTNGTVMVSVNQIPMGLARDKTCSCGVFSEFYLVQIGDETHDTPFPLFTRTGESPSGSGP